MQYMLQVLVFISVMLLINWFQQTFPCWEDNYHTQKIPHSLSLSLCSFPVKIQNQWAMTAPVKHTSKDFGVYHVCKAGCFIVRKSCYMHNVWWGHSSFTYRLPLILCNIYRTTFPCTPAPTLHSCRSLLSII